jgi:hypothetical protein
MTCRHETLLDWIVAVDRQKLPPPFEVVASRRRMLDLGNRANY